MQAFIDNLLARHGVKVRIERARYPVGFTVLPGELPKRIKMPDDFFGTSGKRTRQFAAEYQQLSHQPGLQAFTVEPAVSVDRRHRLKDCCPLIAVHRAANTFTFGQQDMIFYVKQTRGIIGALNG